MTKLESNLPAEAAVTEIVKLWKNEYGYRVVNYTTGLGRPKLVMCGEQHATFPIQRAQLELIQLIRPDFILHEFATAWILDPRTKKITPQPNRVINREDLHGQDYTVSQELMDAAAEIGCQIIGCDASFADMANAARALARANPKKYYVDQRSGQLFKLADPAWICTSQSPEMQPVRESAMATTITAYGRMPGKAMVILGNTHAKRLHQRGDIKNAGFGYVYVDQTKSLS